MKHLKKLRGLLLMLPLVGGWGACGILPDVLPAETQSGKNTFGCLINGKVFIPSASGFNKGGIGKDYDGGLTVSGTAGDGKTVVFYVPNANATGIYSLNQKRLLAYAIEGGCSYGENTPPIKGKVIISKFERGEDKEQNLRWLIVSGTFEGIILPDVKNCTDTIRITQGRFDVKFQ